MTEHLAVLAAAVSEIGGQLRPGQQAMSEAVANSLSSGVHLLIQAGTGTGKSLGYLAPALMHALEAGQPVVIATATLALQAQLATKDIPTALQAVRAVTGKEPVAAILKGRTNYACLYRSREGTDTEQDALLGSASLAEAAKAADEPSRLGAEVLALREWVEEQATSRGLADRDEAPSHTARGWAQVSIPARECLGAANCPFGEECFVEESRERA